MDEATLHEVVTKLVGRIDPVGETNEDIERFNNLKLLTGLVDMLVFDIHRVNYENKDRVEYSRKRAAEYANKFLSEELGIVE